MPKTGVKMMMTMRFKKNTNVARLKETGKRDERKIAKSTCGHNSKIER